MKVFGVYAGAFRGATAWDWQVWRVYGRVLLPSFWKSCGWRRIVSVGWDSGEDEE